jgi:hypothetical protein
MSIEKKNTSKMENKFGGGKKTGKKHAKIQIVNTSRSNWLIAISLKNQENDYCTTLL